MLQGENLIKNKRYIIYALLFIIFAFLRVNSTLQTLDALRSISDTDDYLRIAGYEFFEEKFLISARPIGFPLLLKFARGNEQNASLLQTSLSIFCWGAMGLSVVQSLRSTITGVFGGLVILILGLGDFVRIWDSVILSESLSVSIFVFLLAIGLWLMEKWVWWKAVLFTGVGFMWVFTRDTNLWLMISVSGLIGLFGNKNWLWLSLPLLVISLTANYVSDRAGRWVFPFQNVLAARILPNQPDVEFFSSCGMPVTPELLALEGGRASSKDRAFYNAPELESYREWLEEDGKQCYLKWLLSNPGSSLLLPIYGFPGMISFDRIDRFYSKHYQPLLPDLLDRMIYPRPGVIAVWSIMSILVLITAFYSNWRKKSLWWIWMFLVILIYPHLFLVWHGDTLGLDRHALTLILQYFLCIWLGLLLFMDEIYARATS